MHSSSVRNAHKSQVQKPKRKRSRVEVVSKVEIMQKKSVFIEEFHKRHSRAKFIHDLQVTDLCFNTGGALERSQLV